MAAPIDPKTYARRRFSTPAHCLDLWEIIERYATDPPDVTRTLLEAVSPPRPHASVFELGFGLGWLLEEMARAFPACTLVGLDLSPAMAGHVRDLPGARADVLVGDMEALPFREGAFDVVVTCWTLYFMRDIDGALAEISRCLKPGGRVVAATVAPDHMVEYDRLAAEAERLALGRAEDSDVTVRFNLESGLPYMERHFAGVEVRRWTGSMRIPAVDLLLRFWDAWRPERLAGRSGDLVRGQFERLARDRLRREGEICLRRHGGAFAARKPA